MLLNNSQFSVLILLSLSQPLRQLKQLRLLETPLVPAHFTGCSFPVAHSALSTTVSWLLPEHACLTCFLLSSDFGSSFTFPVRLSVLIILFKTAISLHVPFPCLLVSTWCTGPGRSHAYLSAVGRVRERLTRDGQ